MSWFRRVVTREIPVVGWFSQREGVPYVMSTQAEEFFLKARAIDASTQAALRRLYDLGADPDVTVEFGEKAQDGSMRLYVKRVSPASVVILQADGRLMLMTFDNGGRDVVCDALAALARRLGRSDGDFDEEKPTFPARHWVRDVAAVERMLVALARGQDAVAVIDATPVSAPPAARGPAIRKASGGALPVVALIPHEHATPAQLLGMAPTADRLELDERVNALLRAGLKDMPPGLGCPRKVHVTGAYEYERDPAVKAYVLYVANGVCEACGHSAPFARVDGAPFLEVHHVQPLAEGGPDYATNAVALCPNCHRALHLAADAQERREALYSKVHRLLRSVPAAPATQTSAASSGGARLS